MITFKALADLIQSERKDVICLGIVDYMDYFELLESTFIKDDVRRTYGLNGIPGMGFMGIPVIQKDELNSGEMLYLTEQEFKDKYEDRKCQV